MRKLLLVSIALFVLSCSSSENPEAEDSTLGTEEVAVLEDSIDATVYEEDLMGNGPEGGDCWGSVAVYLNDPDESGTNIRTSPNGDIITKLVIDDEDNIAFFLTVHAAKDGWLQIGNTIDNMARGMEYNSSGECWIHGSVVGVDTRNYGGETIELYDSAYSAGETIATITEELYGLQVLDICGEWVKIRSTEKNLEGWVESKWLCGNPLTSCS